MYDFRPLRISDALEGSPIHSQRAGIRTNHAACMTRLLNINIFIDCHPRQCRFSRLNLEYSDVEAELNQLVNKFGELRLTHADHLVCAAVVTYRCLYHPNSAVVSVSQNQDNNVEMAALESWHPVMIWNESRARAVWRLSIRWS